MLRPGGRVLVFHGVTLRGPTEAETRSRGDSLYKDDSVSAHVLPLRHNPTLDPAIPLAQVAGFANIRVIRLTSIEDFVRRLENKEMTWLVLTADRPARPG
jgi:hypothetical protein